MLFLKNWITQCSQHTYCQTTILVLWLEIQFCFKKVLSSLFSNYLHCLHYPVLFPKWVVQERVKSKFPWVLSFLVNLLYSESCMAFHHNLLLLCKLTCITHNISGKITSSTLGERSTKRWCAGASERVCKSSGVLR